MHYKLTLVNVYLLNVKFDFFVYMLYDYEGELVIDRIDLKHVFDLLKIKLDTNKALNPVVVVGSCWIFPRKKEVGD